MMKHLESSKKWPITISSAFTPRSVWGSTYPAPSENGHRPWQLASPTGTWRTLDILRLPLVAEGGV